MFKKIFALIISITIILVNTKSVNAGVLDIGSTATGLNSSFNLLDSNEKKRSDLSNWIHQNSEWAGFIFDTATPPLLPSAIWTCLPQSVKDQISDSSDDSEVLNKTIDMILEGQSVSGNNITNNTNVNTFLKNVQNNYVNDNPTIGYTFTLSEVASKLTVAAVYDALYDLMKDDEDIRGIIYVVNFYNQQTRVWKFTKQEIENNSLYVSRGNISSVGNVRISAGQFRSMNSSNNISDIPFTYSNDDKKFAIRENVTASVPAISNYLIDNTNLRVGASNINSANYIISKNHRVAFKIFNGTPTVSDYMYSPYYYNNDVWQDFSTSSGDYTFSPTNINTVSYGDTISYIDDYNYENGKPPTLPDININIENTNNNNVNGGSGGGSGDGSGDGSGGNGGGSGSGNDGIFDFLSDLGSVLGNLISNLGQAITNIIKGISDLVTSIVTDLPTVFFDFVGSIFGWLPEEWVTLLSLSLAAMLIWGIVKVIRG